ncbi:cyclic nucleotide-binding domain-containing protein [Candidatus Gracilibacteria bacterium]|nr:cyclic nucleotide-binding domain-containing protein [Candidatus Gracilibacteria bacterium]
MFEGISFFDILTDDERDNLALFCQQRFLKAGDILFNEGDDSIAFYVVKSGSLKVYKDRSEGEKLLGIVQSSEMLGEMGIFDSSNIAQKRMASVKAIEDTSLIVIMNYSIVELSKKRKDIYDKIKKVIEERKEKNIQK